MMLPENEKIETAESQEAVPTTEQVAVEAPIVAEVPKEQGVIQENMPVQVQVPATVPIDPVATTTDDNPVQTAEIKEEFVGAVDHAEEVYVKQAETVMKEYGDQPYKEEEAEEDLHLTYMDKRFGVKIEKGEHTQKK